MMTTYTMDFMIELNNPDRTYMEGLVLALTKELVY